MRCVIVYHTNYKTRTKASTIFLNYTLLLFVNFNLLILRYINLKQTDMHDLLKYISWDSLSDDFGLKSGDISMTQEITLNQILNQFIEQNEKH